MGCTRLQSRHNLSIRHLESIIRKKLMKKYVPQARPLSLVLYSEWNAPSGP